MNHLPINILHIFVIAPFLFYVALIRSQIAPWIYSLLIGIAVVIFVYHGYKSIIKWKAKSPSLWINLIHVLFVAPLLLFIGSKGVDTPRWAYEILAMSAFATLGYHIYSIVLTVQEMSEVTTLKKMPEAKDN